jgi:hypothetical protein
MLQPLYQRAQLFQRFFVFFSKLKQHARIGNLRLEPFLPLNLFLQYAAALEKFLCGVLIVPEIGRRGLLLDDAQFLPASGDIKETSRAARP